MGRFNFFSCCLFIICELTISFVFQLFKKILILFVLKIFVHFPSISFVFEFVGKIVCSVKNIVFKKFVLKNSFFVKKTIVFCQFFGKIRWFSKNNSLVCSNDFKSFFCVFVLKNVVFFISLQNLFC